MSRKYIAKADIEDYLLIDIDSSFDDRIDIWIEAMTRKVEQLTSRVFMIGDGTEEDLDNVTATARLFDGNGSCELMIDDCIEITKLEVSSGTSDVFTEIPSTGANRYLTLPNNAAALNLPINELILRLGIFTEGLQNVRVTAKWGYARQAPDDIKMAVAVFVAGIINSHRSGSTVVKSERIGNYTVSFADEAGWNEFENAKAILDTYKRFSI